MASFKVYQKNGGSAPSNKGAAEVKSTVIKVKKGVFQAGSGTPQSDPLPSSPLMEPGIPAGTPSTEQDGLHVVRQYVQPLHKRHIGGKRLSIYMLVLLAVTATILMVSYFSPWGLIGLEQPFEPAVNVNFSLLRRFPFSNISLPADGAVIQEPTVQITGFIKPGINLYLNSRPISTDDTGFFSTEFILQPGENIFVLEARLGHRKKLITRTVTYDALGDGSGELVLPLSSSVSDGETAVIPDVLAPPGDGLLHLRVYAWPETTWVEAVIDGVQQERQILLQGYDATFAAQDSIVLRTAEGSAVRVWLNGTDLGPMGQGGEAEREFTSDTLVN